MYNSKNNIYNIFKTTIYITLYFKHYFKDYRRAHCEYESERKGIQERIQTITKFALANLEKFF